MTCDDVLLAISLRADGQPGEGPGEVELDDHLAACAGCAAFAAEVRQIRSRLRVEPIDQAPDLGPAVVAALRAHGHGADPTPARRRSGSHRRSGRRRLAVAAAVAGLLGMAADATFVGLGPESPSPAAADVPALVVAAQHDIETVDSRFTVTEVGSGRQGGTSRDRAARTFDGRLVYRAPESLTLSLDETSTGLAGGDRADGRLVVDGDGGRWWHETARRCSDAAARVRCPDETVRWARSVTGREPFSAATPVPLDLVSPVDSFALSGTPPALGWRTIAGHRAVGVEVTAAQIAPLIDALSAVVDLGPVYPADPVDLWLDDQHLVPLELAVRAADDPARARWASTVGATGEPGEVVLTLATAEVRINGRVDDDALRIPPDDAVDAAHLDVGDSGFVATSPHDPALAEVPIPRHLPAGFAVHRSGTVATPGGPRVGVRSWSDGRAWLTVRATAVWTGARLFGDLGPDVRPVDLGAAGTAYVSSDGGRIGLHDGGVDVTVEGSLPPERLQDVAADLGVVGRAVPDGWDEAATADLAGAATAVPGLLTARGLDGFGHPAVRVVPGDGGTTATQVFAGPGQRAFTLTQRPGGLLPPPSAGDETGVAVRNTPGRYSQQGGEIEWIEGGHALSLRSDALSLAELLDVAHRLEPVAGRDEPDDGTSDASSRPDPPPAASGAPAPAERPAPAVPVPEPSTPAILLAWSPDGLDPGLAAAASADPAVDRTSVVRGGVVDLVASRDVTGTPVDRLDTGWAVPLDAIAFRPAAQAELVSLADRQAVATLGPGQALLGSTSARLRRLGAGDVIVLASGQSVTVASVVSDAAVGGAELAVDVPTGEALGLRTDRYLLARYDGDRAALEARLRAALTEDGAVRFRGPGETPFLRHGDAVLPQAHIKDQFGEFAYRPGGDDSFVQDPAWQAANLVTVDLPIIGTARCHRAVVEALAGALDEVVDANLAGLIDPAGFAGCWNARTTRAGTGISRHAWGVAVDLNFGDNPTGLSSVQDPRLLAIFARWGFTDGSGWLVPDAGHIEYVAPPRT